MYKLLFVDDEPLSTIAFQSAFNEAKSLFTLAATATNGAEALDIVSKQDIAAVITDLKMPVLDGLGLIKELKQRNFAGPILVLSNYSDFDYVRSALTLGAYDYLLKINMNADNLNEQLDKMAKLLSEQKRNYSTEKSNSVSIDNQNKHNDISRYIESLNDAANNNEKSLSNELANLIKFPVKLFTVSLQKNDQQTGATLSTISDLLNEILGDVDKLLFRSKNGELTVLVSCHSLEQTASTIDKKLARIKRQMATYFPNTPLVIHYEQPFYLIQANLFQEIRTARVTNNPAEIQNAVEDFWHASESLHISPQKIYETIFLLFEHLGIEKSKQNIEALPTFAALKDYLIKFLLDQLKLQQITNSHFRKEIQSAIVYVNEHFHEKITLDMVAEHVKLNREYFSRLFSKETGTSLFQYINELRMKQAAQLIKNNRQMYIKEVANSVGFDDQFFFSRKFKEYFGQTPSEYAEESKMSK